MIRKLGDGYHYREITDALTAPREISRFWGDGAAETSVNEWTGLGTFH